MCTRRFLVHFLLLNCRRCTLFLTYPIRLRGILCIPYLCRCLVDGGEQAFPGKKAIRDRMKNSHSNYQLNRSLGISHMHCRIEIHGWKLLVGCHKLSSQQLCQVHTGHPFAGSSFPLLSLLVFVRVVRSQLILCMGTFTESKANGEQGGTGFWLIRNICTLFPKSFGYLPVVSTIPGNDEHHLIWGKWIQKTHLAFHQTEDAAQDAEDADAVR